MTAITVDLQPTLGHVRVEVDGADVNATCVQVQRFGDGSPLRTHVWTCESLGEWQHLSGGQAVFFDTEAPLDVAFSYVVLFNDAAKTTLTAGPFTLSSSIAGDSGFWLRDPVRPCNDRRVLLCPPTGGPVTADSAAACLPPSGIWLLGIEAESYASNSAMFTPTNASLPIPVTRPRRGADAALAIATRLFTDRDNVLTTLAPGSPLQFVAPPAYGTPDRYIQVADVQVVRMHPDHRRQFRAMSLPFTTVDRIVGPAQGVCGSQFSDLCDVYASWTAMQAAGLSYLDIERGKAGTGFAELATWNSVQAGFANWTAVSAKTWEQIRTGT